MTKFITFTLATLLTFSALADYDPAATRGPIAPPVVDGSLTQWDGTSGRKLKQISSMGTSGQILQSSGSGSNPTFVNKSISGKAGSATSVTVEEIQTEANHLTQTATNKYKIETGNKNLLTNPTFDALSTTATVGAASSTTVNGWTITTTGTATATLTQETTLGLAGELTWAKLACLGNASGGTCSIKQNVTTTIGQQSVIKANFYPDPLGNCSGPSVAFNTLIGGSTVTTQNITNCGTTNYWTGMYAVPEVAGSTTGIEAKITLGASTSTYIGMDQAYVAMGDIASPASIITPWQSYTPTFTGFGTVASVSYYWRQNGDSVEISGTHTNGTTAVSVASMTLPNSYTLNTSKLSIPANTTAASGSGVGIYRGPGANEAGTVVTAPGTSTSLVYFGGINSSTSGLIPRNGSDILTSSTITSINLRVPIANLAGSTQVFASNCGANCENEFSAKVSAAGAVSAENVDWITSCTNATPSVCSFQPGLFTASPNCSVEASLIGTYWCDLEGDPTTSSVSFRCWNDAGGDMTTTTTKVISCQKQGTDYISSRTIVGSFKDTPKIPGTGAPKILAFSFGQATENSVCSASPCTVHRNYTGGALTSVTRQAVADYELTWVAGTWSELPRCFGNNRNATRPGMVSIPGTTAKTFTTTTMDVEVRDASNAAPDSWVDIVCVGF